MRYRELIGICERIISNLEEDKKNVIHKDTIKALDYCIALKKSNISRYERWEKENSKSGMETI